MGKDIAIRIQGLGKRYQLGNVVDLSRTFCETLVDLPRFFCLRAKKTLKKMISQPAIKETEEDLLEHDYETPRGTFWALRDINLEIPRGEVLGIIGRNGAGKSTLLKILSRITTPTKGRIEINGRVGSLLEVGTGFHEELTGKENIYLNGAILGMRKAEIENRFDEIVDFAGTDQFLDTPIKRYSSGMRVRLAFSVAAHLEPEILIVDEVLAVGDAEFQKRCLNKMEHVTGEGRTVIFVSHNMAAIQSLCNLGVYLDKGKISYMGDVNNCIDYYLSNFANEQSMDLSYMENRLGDGRFRFTSIHLEDFEGNTINSITPFMPFRVVMGYESFNSSIDDKHDFVVAISIHDQLSAMMCHMSSEVSGDHLTPKTKDYVSCTLKKGLPLAPGHYYLNGIIRFGGILSDQVENVYTIEIRSYDLWETGRIPKPVSKVWTPFQWEYKI